MNWRAQNQLRKAYFLIFYRKAKRALNKSVQIALEQSKYSSTNLEYFVNDLAITDFYKEIYRVVAYNFGKETFLHLTGLKKGGVPYKLTKDLVTTVPDLQQFESIMQNYLQTYALSEVGNRISGINATTRNFIRQVVADAISNGYSIERTSKELRSGWKKLTENRARLIARTEILSASNAGAIVGAGATGLPLQKIWLATKDKRTREAHYTADGQAVDLDEPYTVNGELLMHPGDSSLGASATNTILCRCAQRFKVK